MMIIALLLRGMVSFCSIPQKLACRLLADDFIIVGMGQDHVEALATKFEAAATYIKDMGARVAIKKSFVFSSDAVVRQFLQCFRWDFAHGPLHVLTNFRDLGAHLNVGFQRNGATLTSRMLVGLPKFGRISKLPYPSSVKTHFVCNGMFSGCFYGCEASYVIESVCEKVASAVSSCLAPKAARRSKHMLFSCLDRECDPFAFVLSRRVSMLRRMLVMYPWLGEPVATILQNYLNRGFPGAALAPGEAASHVAPSMEVPGSTEAKAKYFSMGPMGHLLHSLASGLDLNVVQNGEVPFNLHESPYQYLKPLIRGAVLRKRSKWVAAER